MKLVLPWLVAASLSVTAASAQAGLPDATGPADAAVGDVDSGVAPPPEPVCAPETRPPSQAVRTRFSDLHKIYRLQLPGPRGEVVVRQRVDKLIAEAIDVDTFVESILTKAWRRATPFQRELWHYAIESMLRSRYLKWLRSPLQHRLGILDFELECHRAEVSARLTNTRKGTEKPLGLALIFVTDSWRVYDVTINDVSLLETWRSRFRRIYRDGGVDAVHRQMNILAHRYGQLDQIPRPPPPVPLEPPAPEGPSMSERPGSPDR